MLGPTCGETPRRQLTAQRNLYGRKAQPNSMASMRESVGSAVEWRTIRGCVAEREKTDDKQYYFTNLARRWGWTNAVDHLLLWRIA
jgi:hypothetical protein